MALTGRFSSTPLPALRRLANSLPPGYRSPPGSGLGRRSIEMTNSCNRAFFTACGHQRGIARQARRGRAQFSHTRSRKAAGFGWVCGFANLVKHRCSRSPVSRNLQALTSPSCPPLASGSPDDGAQQLFRMGPDLTLLWSRPRRRLLKCLLMLASKARRMNTANAIHRARHLPWSASRGSAPSTAPSGQPAFERSTVRPALGIGGGRDPSSASVNFA